MIAVLKSPREFPFFAVTAGVAASGIAAVSLLGLDRLSFGICLFKLATGLPCLSCGTTRALGHLAHGDLAGAMLMNPLFATGALLLLALGTAEAALLLRGRVLRPAFSDTQARAAWIALAVFTLVNWAWLVADGR